MQRREFSSGSIIALALGLLPAAARAQPLASLSSGEATQGLKAALEQGAISAVNLLGKPGGFLENPKVRIPLPGYLEDAAGLLRMTGLGGRLDELVTAMNRAAEQAVPMAKDMLVDAAKSMSVTDAKNVLTGGETSVTDYFAKKTRAPLFKEFLPVAARATENVGAASLYNQVAGKAAGFNLVKAEDAKIEGYVANKALDGLFLMIGEEEKKLRANPLGASSDLLRKVFGSLK
ncbi:MAG: DUF4197 domain-containing protein [Burkholderiales bacterium]